jgi:hypothetical protein
MWLHCQWWRATSENPCPHFASLLTRGVPEVILCNSRNFRGPCAEFDQMAGITGSIEVLPSVTSPPFLFSLFGECLLYLRHVRSGRIVTCIIRHWSHQDNKTSSWEVSSWPTCSHTFRNLSTETGIPTFETWEIRRHSYYANFREIYSAKLMYLVLINFISVTLKQSSGQKYLRWDRDNIIGLIKSSRAISRVRCT